MNDRDQLYLEILLRAIRVCANYRPKLGQGRQSGLTLYEFRALYSADPFYSWFGLDSPLMYAAHRAAGGMTSIYRQIGIGSQWLFNQILCDYLGLDTEQANWSYAIPGENERERRLSLDARIPLDAVSTERKLHVIEWCQAAARAVELSEDFAMALKGAVFEVRQGYKSKDSKRQNADVSNASNAYAHHYLPVVAMLSTQIDNDVALRYRRARWLLLQGTIHGSTLDSTYLFLHDIVGYDLADFFSRHSSLLRKEIEAVLEVLLNAS